MFNDCNKSSNFAGPKISDKIPHGAISRHTTAVERKIFNVILFKVLFTKKIVIFVT